jgi:hypothetical protein
MGIIHVMKHAAVLPNAAILLEEGRIASHSSTAAPSAIPSKQLSWRIAAPSGCTIGLYHRIVL